MPSNAYNQYLTSIKAANDARNKEALRKIGGTLNTVYGPLDDDTDYLIRLFRYNI